MAEKSVFLDTSGLYAWINRSDPWHQAMCDLPKAKGCRLILTDYIVDEACTLFMARKIFHQRQRLFQLIDHSKIVNFTWIGPDLLRKRESGCCSTMTSPFPSPIAQVLPA